jgi:hypothetical protein
MTKALFKKRHVSETKKITREANRFFELLQQSQLLIFFPILVIDIKLNQHPN